MLPLARVVVVVDVVGVVVVVVGGGDGHSPQAPARLRSARQYLIACVSAEQDVPDTGRPVLEACRHRQLEHVRREPAHAADPPGDRVLERGHRVSELPLDARVPRLVNRGVHPLLFEEQLHLRDE